MNINPEFNSPQEYPCPTEVVEIALDYFGENLLAPMIENLDEEQIMILGTIGESLRIMARDAKAWEEYQNLSDKNNHFRN
jgi:hypothetical protein